MKILVIILKSKIGSKSIFIELDEERKIMLFLKRDSKPLSSYL
jgi:hypothetical protein